MNVYESAYNQAQIDELLKNFPPEEKQTLFYKTVHEGRYLLRSGDPAEMVYVLIQGEAVGVSSSSGMETVYAAFKPFTFIGESEVFLKSKQYRSDILCKSECVFMGMRQSAYVRWMKRDGEALWKRSEALVQLLHQQARAERDKVNASAYERVCAYLKEKTDCSMTSQGEKAFKESHQSIADATSLSLKTVQRILNRLTSEGKIRKEKRTLWIKGFTK